MKLDAAGESITVPLDPLPAAAQILTNFTSGRVSIDGRPAGELTNSQFTLDALPFGAHTIAVSSPDGEANVAFNASPGAMPALTGSVRTRNADAVVLSSMGQTGNVACDCPDAPVLIDGKPAGRIGADGLRIGGLAAGTRELQVGERNFVVGIRPEPELSIFLSADRPVGTLVVETNAPGAAILIDGKPAGTAGGRTPFQMPLAAGPHRVEVKSPGYRPAPPRIANVENRKTLRLSVPLDALKGQLAVLAAAAGTSVSIDGKPAGTVGPDGSLTVDGIEPGERNVGLARAGYAPKQMTLRFEAGRRVKLTTPAVDLSPDQNTLAEDRRKEEKASWDRVDKSNRAALQQFLNQNPNGAYAGDAKKTLAALDQQAQAERKREAEQREEAEWTAVNKADRTALQQFVDRRPNSPPRGGSPRPPGPDQRSRPERGRAERGAAAGSATAADGRGSRG
ncbi:MAG: PEGA domain-containing protein [Acidobacteriia bacterium]|nr:PEGA domain-containing protein [Terriglobia bacterium]